MLARWAEATGANLLVALSSPHPLVPPRGTGRAGADIEGVPAVPPPVACVLNQRISAQPFQTCQGDTFAAQTLQFDRILIIFPDLTTP